jgi:hypothetical protein
MALDKEKTKQLKGYLPQWQKGYGVVRKAACIVAAARSKGQGLLLTVEEQDKGS